MKRFLMTVALTSALSSAAFAGEIPSVGVASPAPGKTTQTASATSPGDIPTGGVADQTSSAALSALLTLLRLFGI